MRHLQGPLSTFLTLTLFLPTTIHTQCATFFSLKRCLVLIQSPLYHKYLTSMVQPFSIYLLRWWRNCALHTMYIDRRVVRYVCQNPRIQNSVISGELLLLTKLLNYWPFWVMIDVQITKYPFSASHICQGEIIIRTFIQIYCASGKKQNPIISLDKSQ